MSVPAGLPSRLARAGRCLVMGVVNVTPDSFSDGGRFSERARAVEHGLALVADGADIVDVGGESTRPGAGRVPVEEELRRVLPVVADLSAAGVLVSIDTMRAEVADAALAAGAALVNDVSGGLADRHMAGLVAEACVPYVVMHWRGPSAEMEGLAVYEDVVRDVVSELRGRVDALVDAGVDVDQIVLDPGFGFAKTAEHNWALLASLDRLVGLGRPLLVGTSRKRFLAAAVAVPASDGTAGAGRRDPADPTARDAATAATTTLAAAAGAWCVRVHAAGPSADAVRVVAAAARGATAPGGGSPAAAGEPPAAAGEPPTAQGGQA